MYREPEFVKEYYRRRPPKCCFTCEHFLTFTATCLKFDQVVPEKFARDIDQCGDWVEMRIPF